MSPTMWSAEQDAPSISPASCVFTDDTATTQLRGATGVQHSIAWLASHSDAERRSGSRVATLVGLGFDAPEVAWFKIARQRATTRRVQRAMAASLVAQGRDPDKDLCPLDVKARVRDAMDAARARERTVVHSAEGRRRARLDVDLGETNRAVAKGTATERTISQRVSVDLATTIFPGGVYSHVDFPHRLASLDGELVLSRADGSGTDRAIAEFKSLWRPPHHNPAHGLPDLTPRASYIVQCTWNLEVLGAGRPGGPAAAILGVGYIDDDKWVDESNRADVMAWRSRQASLGLPATQVRVWTLFPDPELMGAIHSLLQELDAVIDALLSRGVSITPELLKPWVHGAINAEPRNTVLKLGTTYNGLWCVGLSHQWRRGPYLLESIGEDLPDGMSPSPAGPGAMSSPPIRAGSLLSRAFSR